MRIVQVATSLLSSAPYDRDVARSVVNLQHAFAQQQTLLDEAVGTLHARIDELEVFDGVLNRLDRGLMVTGGFSLPRARQMCRTTPSGTELASLMAWRRRASSAIDHMHRFLTGVHASNPGSTPRRIPGDPLPPHYPNGMQQCVRQGHDAAKGYIKQGRRP